MAARPIPTVMAWATSATRRPTAIRWPTTTTPGSNNTRTDSAGHVWDGIGTLGFSSDGHVRRTHINHGVGGTEDDFIFERMVYATQGDLSWSKSGLPDGTYTVRLYFAEVDADNPSRFHINVQGGAVERSNFSPMESGGGANQAVTVTLSGVTVTDGTLTLDLIRVTNAPLISGIAITN